MLDSEIRHDQRRRPLIKACHPGRIGRLESRRHARGLSSRATQMLRNGWLDAHVPPDPMFFGSALTLGPGLEEMISPMSPGGNPRRCATKYRRQQFTTTPQQLSAGPGINIQRSLEILIRDASVHAGQEVPMSLINGLRWHWVSNIVACAWLLSSCGGSGGGSITGAAPAYAYVADEGT